MPAYAENVKTVTLEAQADHTGDQHKLVVTSGARGFALAGAGAAPYGVLLNKPSDRASADGTLNTNSGFSDGAGGTIAIIDAGGVAPVVSGGAITAGSRVAAGADGKAVAAGAGDDAFGVAQAAASGADEYVPVLFNRSAGSA